MLAKIQKRGNNLTSRIPKVFALNAQLENLNKITKSVGKQEAA